MSIWALKLRPAFAGIRTAWHITEWLGKGRNLRLHSNVLFMTVDMQNLIDALRNELQQYGEMLALLDHQQQELTTQRADNGNLESVAAIQAQSATIQAARQRRDQLQQELARALQQPDQLSLTVLIPLLPQHYRPLVSALVQENNELLQRVGQRARQNQRMLQQAAELMQSFIASLTPADLAQVAGASETPAVTANPNSTCCEATG